MRNSDLKPPIYDLNSEVIFNVKNIMQMLPHRYPFQMVDKIIHLDENSVTGIKNVTINEPYFQGHFPTEPVMPGVLQVESMVQTGGVLVLNTVPDPDLYLTYFLGIDDCRFKKKVVPGDTLILHSVLLSPIKLGIAKMHAQAFVGTQLVSEAVLVAQIVKQKDLSHK